MNIRTSYRLSFEELLRASRLGQRRRRQVMWGCVLLLLPDGVLLFALGNVPLGIAGTGVGAVVLYQLTVGTRRAVRRSLTRLGGTVEVGLTDGGVRIQRPGASSETGWDRYHRVVDTPEFLLLYTGPTVFTAVLKRGLDAAERAELAAFVAALNGTTAAPARPAPPQRVVLSRAVAPGRGSVPERAEGQ
ncbi:YcxB family protein [Kitasatospora sp. NPDC048540]|uniref:YcxB family protein n=1 Tax=unclassified Kitasatospora TaxID=2633591 RepID=UPI00053B3446|nr:YcxB family protein [Kitasatospora sp. MBT63]